MVARFKRLLYLYSACLKTLFSLSTDVPDQSAIVRQYMRFTGQIYSGKNVRETVLRGLQLYVSKISIQSTITHDPTNDVLEQ